jgi:RNA polymerase sigma-70 factor (ECF subfamily)
MTEAELLAAAKGADGDAFAALTAPHRRALHVHCYRMLGSVQDAEDAVQETLLRAWRGLPRFEGRGSLRSWLYATATNVCVRAIERRPSRVLPFDYGPAADAHERPASPLEDEPWLEPYPDERLGVDTGLAGPEARYEQRESIELAFIAALQHLPARQRAVLILREVLGFSGSEVANALGTSPAAVYSALQRAHETVAQRLPERSQQATLQALGDAGLRRIVDRYVKAWERGDVDAIVAMLTDDAILAMPPIPSWYRGRVAIAETLRIGPLGRTRRWRSTVTRANGQPAILFEVASGGGAASRGESGSGGEAPFVAHSVAVLTLRGTSIEQITAFHDPVAVARFG